MSGKPYWTDDDEWGEFLHTPGYNEEFNKAMKDIVPDTERRWNKQKRAWWISHGWLDEVEVLLREHYPEYVTNRDV